MIPVWYQGALAGAAAKKKWYEGSLIAYDSSNFANGTFTDYMGGSILAAAKASGVGTEPPSVSNQAGLEYGPGIRMPLGAWIATATGTQPGTIFSSSFTLDLWHKQDSNSLPLPLYLMTAYPNTLTGVSYTNRLLVGQGTGESGNGPTANISLWNNAQNPRTWSTWQHQFATSTWKHIAITYDDVAKVLTFYRNGVNIGTITYNLQPVTGAIQFGMINFASAGTSYVERYRFRQGIHFTGSSFNLSSIYP